MGGIQDNRWVDLMIYKIGFALTKVDESIQKSIELWKELTKDIYDEQPTHDTTVQPNNGKPGEEDSPQDKYVAEVKERPVQQHWAMCASKIPESLFQQQGEDEVEEKEEEEEDEEGTVSESSGDEDICELILGNSPTRYRPNRHHHHNEAASTDLSLKWKDHGYEQLKDDDKSWGGAYDEKLWKSYPRVPLGFCYLPPMHPLHKENNALYLMRLDRYHMSLHDNTSCKQEEEEEEEEEKEEEEEETNSETSYIPSGYHHRNEEETDSRDRYELLKMASLRARNGYEPLKNDDTSSEDDDSWNEAKMMEWMRKHRTMRDVTNISLVDDDDIHDDDIDDDNVWDMLFVDVKKEEVENKTECGEVETLSSECDWVYVTRDDGLD